MLLRCRFVSALTLRVVRPLASFWKRYTAGAVIDPFERHQQTISWFEARSDGSQGYSPQFTPLDVAAASRRHRELRIALRYGLIDPDSAVGEGNGGEPKLATTYASAQGAIKRARSATPWNPLELRPDEPAPPIRIIVDSHGNQVQFGYHTLPCKAVCLRTVRTVIAATRGWGPTRHWLHHVGVRTAVHTLLLVSERLARKQDALLCEEAAVEEGATVAADGGGGCGNAAAAAAAGGGDGGGDGDGDGGVLREGEECDLALCTLPPELWLVVASFCNRCDWTIECCKPEE